MSIPSRKTFVALALAFPMVLASLPVQANLSATQVVAPDRAGAFLGASHAPDVRVAMMDDMGMMGMGGGMNNMPSGNAMPGPDPSGGMQGPMAMPPRPDPMGMGRMRESMQGQRGMGSMTPTARLPGFPGASHLYHIGSTGFFLDHPQHITLSTEQQTTLNRLKEKALLEQASSQRRVEDAEQELWLLTAADAPDAAKIEAKVRAIEKLRSDQRLAYIRAVGEAGKVLTADQQAALLGTRPPAGSRPAARGMAPATGQSAPMPAAPAASTPMSHM